MIASGVSTTWACAARGRAIKSAISHAVVSTVAIAGMRASDLLFLILAMLLGFLLTPLLVHAADAKPAGPAAAPARAEVQSSLYAGRLLTVDQNGAGSYQRGTDLWTLRLVMAVPFPLGIRVAARGDLTSLGQIDPNNLDLTSVRTAEGYGAISKSWKVAGFDVGPAVGGGALVPVQASAWVYQGLVAGGLRIGHGRSWAYAFVGVDGAADAACACDGGLRFIAPASVEFKRFAAIADFVSGSGGRVRAGILFRIPMP